MVTHKIKYKGPKDSFESQAWNQGRLVCGVDEVGRGCLAGPVLAAAVILRSGKRSRMLKDSKIMDQQEREAAFAWIKKNAWYAVGIAHHRAIDTHNIYYASLIAMRRAVMHLLAIAPHEPSCILVDAMPLKIEAAPIMVYHFPFGESKSSSIAAASIVAKVTRDALMRRMDTIFPGYYLVNHKGYRTPAHKKAVFSLGHTIIHRMSYMEAFHKNYQVDHEQQQTVLF